MSSKKTCTGSGDVSFTEGANQEDFVFDSLEDSEPVSCESVFYQKEKVCIPVKVTPYATPGIAKATCCGDPVVSAGTNCSGTQAACTFTLTQSLCIAVPIAFGADIETGTAMVECGEASEKGCECSEEED
jgi:hypothetical protein